jgi:hypothetical protein
VKDTIRAFTSSLSSQEERAYAIRLGAPQVLIKHVQSSDDGVVKAACEALIGLNRLLEGRLQTVEHRGIEAVASVMLRAPLQASQCIMEISQTLQGAHAIVNASRDVVGDLAKVFRV